VRSISCKITFLGRPAETRNCTTTVISPYSKIIYILMRLENLDMQQPQGEGIH